MTFIPGFKSRVVCGDFSFSAYITDWSEPFTVDMLDVTVPTSPGNGTTPSRVFIPGQTSSTLTMKGFLDPDGTSDLQYDQINDWTGAEAVTFGPSGLTAGAELLLTSGLTAKSETGATTTTPVSFSLDVQNTGLCDRGVSLHDLTAETLDGSSTGYDGGASSANGAVAHLHVTAFSGFTSNAVIIEDSANNSTWATIGTFATATALTQERLVIAGTVRRYVRCSWDLTGTPGTTTFQVGLARR